MKDIKSKHYKIRKSVWYREAKAKKLYKEFSLSGKSLRNFAEHKNIVAMTLSNMFREFISEYESNPRVNASKQFL